MWYAFSWSNPAEYHYGKMLLTAGRPHSLVCYAFEGCCDGAQQIMVKLQTGVWVFLAEKMVDGDNIIKTSSPFPVIAGVTPSQGGTHSRSKLSITGSFFGNAVSDAGLPLGVFAWYRSKDITVGSSAWKSVVGDFTGSKISGSSNALGAQRSSTTVAAGFGQTGTLKFLKGGPSDSYSFGTIVPSGYFTMCALSRYSGASRNRIINGDNYNFLHGHWSGRRGVFYYEGWMTDYSGWKETLLDQWLISCSGNGVNYAMVERTANSGFENTANAGPLGNRIATGININRASELSDYEVAEIIVWNRALTLAELASCYTYLSNVLNGGFNLPKPSNVVAWFKSSDITVGSSTWASAINSFTATKISGTAVGAKRDLGAHLSSGS